MVIVIHPPGFDDRLRLRQGDKLMHKRPLNDSMKACSTGFPGRMNPAVPRGDKPNLPRRETEILSHDPP